jgi:hypothetical protein
MSENPSFRHPVVVIAFILIAGVFILIGSALFGLDRGGLVSKLGETSMARGLITYLFAVTTIGIAIVVVVMGLTGGSEIQERFDRGKEVLALLLGVFGTIVGFYYGSELTEEDRDAYRLTPAHLSAEAAGPGETIRVTAYVAGGTPPYEYRILVSEELLAEGVVRSSEGWVDALIALPSDAEKGLQRVNLETKDGADDILISSAIVEVVERSRN